VSLKPFETVVADHGPTVLRVCRAVLGWAEAEDAWSETFLAALRAYPRLRPDSNLQAWLVTIAHRKALDQRRARARREVPTDPLPQKGAPDRGHTHLEGGLSSALAALPPKQRQAVAYHHLGGLTYREVARVLGGTEAAARRAAADGLLSLRRRLRKGETR
jgi:RNA polymerase sigma factor (sigma-70 family)